ncbi:hypothetical protein JR316_0008911 [Psilocybe cubensis]|uniref:Uncharacterized protein n=1 Tax=Psilocybe cubensis TaxID=181762 RepID=A0ACB8GSA9_PSICU|nr:hypothetical protein JR316_0008911 [Psilocybe cubensis]KAH9478456.1 hypothetical protein JR316_0008911 [Psilocybe cubensis]
MFKEEQAGPTHQDEVQAPTSVHSEKPHAAPFPQTNTPRGEYPMQQMHASSGNPANQQQTGGTSLGPVDPVMGAAIAGQQYRDQLLAQCAAGQHEVVTNYGILGIIMAVLKLTIAHPPSPDVHPPSMARNPQLHPVHFITLKYDALAPQLRHPEKMRALWCPVVISDFDLDLIPHPHLAETQTRTILLIGVCRQEHEQSSAYDHPADDAHLALVRGYGYFSLKPTGPSEPKYH